MNRLLLLVLLILAVVMGCSPKSAPPATTPDFAAEVRKHRSGYIQAILEGRWCDAPNLFEESRRILVRTDDFCGAAANYLDLWRLTTYVGKREDRLLTLAAETSAVTSSCPEVDATLNDPVNPGTPRESRYIQLIRSGSLDLLAEELLDESNPLFKSVYFRKGALEAIRLGRHDDASRYLDQARAIDSAQGWTALLIEDWKLALALQPDENGRQRIIRRIDLLKTTLQPCTLTWDQTER
jgi:hypothetical protein